MPLSARAPDTVHVKFAEKRVRTRHFHRDDPSGTAPPRRTSCLDPSTGGAMKSIGWYPPGRAAGGMEGLAEFIAWLSRNGVWIVCHR